MSAAESDLAVPPRPIVDPARPAPTYTLRRLLPYGVVLVLSALSPAIPHHPAPILRWWLAAFGAIALLGVACAVAAHLPNGHWWHTATPLLVLPVVQFLRAADGFAASGFTPLVVLSIVWLALYGRLRDVIIGIVAVALMLAWPIVLIGAPRYPANGWRGTLLLTTVIGAAGLLINGLVRSARLSNERLATSEQQFRAAFDDAPVGMALIGLRGEDSGRFLRVNRALCAMFGRPAEELTGTPLESVTYPEDIAVLRAWFDRTAREDIPQHVEKRYVHTSGRVIWASVSFSIVRTDAGRPLHLICQIEDVSARRQSDQALLDALQSERLALEQLRELDTVRTTMLSNAAHDLRTPMTSAAGFTELLLDGTAGALTAEQHSLLETVARSIDRMAGIVEDLVAPARREAGTAPPARTAFDVGFVLDGATHAMSILSSSARQTFTVDNGLHGVVVEGDAGRFDRALSNLIGNAVKFTPPGGNVRVTGEMDVDRAVITVSDTGIGIEPRDQERIFERYYRAEDANNRSITGSGLGLAIVHEIVAQHDGTITVESAAGKGARFTISVPASVPPDASPVGAGDQGLGSGAHVG